MMLQRQWWLDMLLAFITMGLGLYCFAWPDLAIVTLGQLFNIFLLLFGLFALVTSWEKRGEEGFLLSLLEGVFYLLLAAILFFTGDSIIILNRILGLYFILLSLVRFLGALLYGIPTPPALIAESVGFILGLILLFYPQIFAGFFTLVLGLVLLIAGLALLAYAFSSFKRQRSKGEG